MNSCVPQIFDCHRSVIANTLGIVSSYPACFQGTLAVPTHSINIRSICFVLAHHDVCLKRIQIALEKQHQEARIFLQKLKEKKLRELNAWKLKHARMREALLQQVRSQVMIDLLICHTLLHQGSVVQNLIKLILD